MGQPGRPGGRETTRIGRPGVCPGALKLDLTLFRPPEPAFYSLDVCSNPLAKRRALLRKKTRFPRSQATYPTTRRRAEALDLGLASTKRGQPALHVTKPSQIGVA